jgi:hypothetical protein
MQANDSLSPAVKNYERRIDDDQPYDPPTVENTIR